MASLTGTSKYIMVIDTETTGLPPRNEDPINYKKWRDCRIVQFAYRLYNVNDSNEHILTANDCVIIKPDGFLIPQFSAKIHSITTEIANKEGITIHQMFKKIQRVITDNSIDVLVAHNMDFDNNVVLSEMYRYEMHQLAEKWSAINKLCTMKEYSDPNKKWSKLSELYKEIFNKEPDIPLHSADNDAQLCAEIYFAKNKDKKN